MNYGHTGRFITGMKSTYNWFFKDRRFGFYYCEVEKDDDDVKDDDDEVEYPKDQYE